MISFDTFTGEAHGAIDEQRGGTLDEPLHIKRRTGRRSARGHRRSRRSDSDAARTPTAAAANTTDDEHGFSDDAATSSTGNGDVNGNGNGRMSQLFQLLSLKNHTRDAKRALVERLLGVTNVTALVLSKATEDQIASAANDAITDEILATVDMEDKRRQSETIDPSLLIASAVPANAIVVAAQDAGPYRVLELVDVLDSTTGGLVKRILTNVRRRQRHGAWRTTAFCGFCVDYRTHATAQHKCRICGVRGLHRSQFCTQTTSPQSSSSLSSSLSSSRPLTPHSRRRMGSATPTTEPADDNPENAENPTNPQDLENLEDPEMTSVDTASRLTPDASDKSYCTFCGTWGFHSTANHRCRICSVQGDHRSRHCTAKTASEAYRWRGSPAADTGTLASTAERKFCDLCNALRNHTTDEHRCRICLKLGEHRSKTCPMHTPMHTPTPTPPDSSSPARPPSRGRRTPMTQRTFCAYCGKDAAHRSDEHICRICRATGLHRSGDCPARGSHPPLSSSQSVLSYSVETASKVRDRVLESIPLVLPASASTLVMDSIDKVGDVDTIIRRTLQRLGVWGGGSQTPITTPYAAPATPIQRARQSSAVDLPALRNVDGHGVYVVSYAEGRSVVPERILKYMRLLMHHEISTNAFSVVVVFDPRPSTWELEKPGMVTPRSLPSSPTMSEQLKKRMAKYTLQTLLGARDKLVTLIVAQKRMQQQQQQGSNRRDD